MFQGRFLLARLVKAEIVSPYYGIDFHDLAPDSFLHITTFIVMCEAFLRVTPHFGLWLKTFEVKLKMIEGQHAACGGASIRKMTGASWPKVPSQRCLNCGNRSGSTSRLLEAPSGRPPLFSARALHDN